MESNPIQSNPIHSTLLYFVLFCSTLLYSTLSIYLLIYSPVCLSFCLSICLPIYLSMRKPEKEASHVKHKSCVLSWRPRTTALRNFSTPSVLSTSPATKKWGQVIRSAAPVMQIVFPKPKIWCSKMQPVSRNQRPDLLTSLMNMFLVLPPGCILADPL